VTTLTDGKLGMKVDAIPGGLLVTQVSSPAAVAAGFLANDVIQKVDAMPAALPEIRSAAERIRFGQPVVFTVRRPVSDNTV
jgi:S1-C subfamily serine protease